MHAKLVVLVGLVVACYADEPIIGTNSRLTAQEKFLARDPVANFACKVDSVSVRLDVAGDEDKMSVTSRDLESSLTQTASLEWAHVNQFFFSSLDGRNDEKILGTAGGDMGEFIQALESFTKITGTVLTAEEVDGLFARLLKTMSRNKFFFETDEKAYRKLAIATGCQNLKIAEVGEKRKKDAILAKFASDDMAEFIGDPFIKYLAENSEASGVRREYITYAIQSFHKNLWKNNVQSQALCYLEVKGRHEPQALIHIETPGYCVDQGLAPLISSQVCAGQALINHKDAVKLFRRELVNLVAREGNNPQDILAKFNEIAQGNLAKFWETFSGLPTYTVKFSYSAPVLSESQ